MATWEQIEDTMIRLEEQPDFPTVARTFLRLIPEDDNVSDDYALKKVTAIFDAMINDDMMRLFQILTGSDFEKVLEICQDVSGTKLCIKQLPGRYWKCFFCDEVPPNAYLLSEEGSYPVDLYYTRKDVMGSSVIAKDTLDSKDELLVSLKWHGKCQHRIWALWDYEQGSATTSKEILAIFADAEAAVQERCADMVSDFMDTD